MFANPRSVWKDYIIKTILEAQRSKQPLQLFIVYHQKNILPEESLVNETTCLLKFDFSKDILDINDKTFIMTGRVNNFEFKFSGVDIIQLTPYEEVQYKPDPKLLKQSLRKLKFTHSWKRE